MLSRSWFWISERITKIEINYLSAHDKLEIKTEILSNYQLKIANDYNIYIANDKKIVHNFFKKKVCASLQKPATKKCTLCVVIWSIKITKTILQFQYTIKNRSRKEWKKRWKIILQINEQ